MTQELVIGVLLTGLVGLVWAMTVALFWGDHPAAHASKIDSAKGSGTMCGERPEGRSDKWFLTPSQLSDKAPPTGPSKAA
jgi:hypothetical protein